MTAKEYLNQIDTYELKIKQLEQRKQELRLRMLPSGISYEKDRVQTSPKDQMSEYAVKLDELTRETENTIIEYEKKKNEIIGEIQNLTDSRHITILFNRYVNHISLENIARNMKYDYKWVCKLHSFALIEFEKINPNCLIEEKHDS